MFGPVLKGTKVKLRPPDATDAARFIEWFADTEVTRYLGTAFPLSLQGEEEAIKRLGEDKNTVWWVIEAEGKAIGASGIHRIDWINANAVTGTVIGDTSMWRKGYGSEAMALRTEYAFRQLNLHKLKSARSWTTRPASGRCRRRDTERSGCPARTSGVTARGMTTGNARSSARTGRGDSRHADDPRPLHVC